jgi:pimeloyl-ACP methyl ester carboxylesterase
VHDPTVDCFYVYPTISGEATINANRAIGFRELAVALAQASRFSQACRVYAPAYRQITLSALQHPARITRADALVAYDSVRSAFRDYLAHYNHGRGIVFIGHSQGATILTQLLRREVDGVPSMKRRLVSALLLGGNVTVRRGRSTGGDFSHIPTCTSDQQTGCVVAYSSFTAKPPPNSQFGRTTSDAGVHLLAPANPSRDRRIMCVNPAAPAGGSAPLDPYLPALALRFLHNRHKLMIKTPWVSFPGEYSAQCESSGNATWLQVTHIGRHDRRPLLTGSDDATLGLHILDVNIALGNLVRLVRDEAAAFAR